MKAIRLIMIILDSSLKLKAKNIILEITINYSMNDLISICNILYSDNSGSLDDLTTRTVSCLYGLNFIKGNIIHDDNSLK